MAENKGLLTGLVESMSIMPTIVFQFADATMGERMKNMKVEADDGLSRARGMAVLSKSTFDHNFVGRISIRVPKLWDNIASFDPKEWANKPIDEKVKLIEDVAVCDAQNALAIDWAKKNPDLFVQWLFFSLEKNDLISECYKNASIATSRIGENGKPIYNSEVVMEETGALNGTFGVPAYIHEALKSVPKTKGLKVTGTNANGYATWEEEAHEEFDVETMSAALFNVEGQLENIKRPIVAERLREASKHVEGKSAQKLNSLARKVMRKFTLTAPFSTPQELASIAHEFSEVARKELPMDAIYTIIGYIAHNEKVDRETAVKLLANQDLLALKQKVNGFAVYDTQKLSDRLLTTKQAINTFGPMWVIAARENGEKVEETAAETLSAEDEQEILEKLAEEAGF